jgi:hypothetical protein
VEGFGVTIIGIGVGGGVFGWHHHPIRLRANYVKVLSLLSKSQGFLKNLISLSKLEIQDHKEIRSKRIRIIAFWLIIAVAMIIGFKLTGG